MNKRYSFLLISIVLISAINSQHWKATGALPATGASFYLVAATSVGNNIFAAHANKNLGYSTDLGKTWITDGINEPKGDFALLTGIKDRLYASMKTSPSDYELLYTTNNGQSWTMDTIGLPRAYTIIGITSMIVVDMGNDYIFAHNYLKAFYKHKNDAKWTPTEIGSAVVDVVAIKDKWIIVVAGKIIQSTDRGKNWTTMISSGLPDKFQGNKICTNGARLYLSNPPANGAQDVYYSDDEGASWTVTSIGGLYTHPNAWVQNLYAVDDYVFAAILPKQFDFNSPPPFIVSSQKSLSFTVGDVSGFPTGSTVSNLPFFFHVQNKLFTMFGDIYVSEPGFTGTSAVKNVSASNMTISVYPNPSDRMVKISSKNAESFELAVFDVQGKMVHQQIVHTSAEINVSMWQKGIYFVKSTYTDGSSEHIKFIKR